MKKGMQLTLFLVSLLSITANAQWFINRFAGSYDSYGYLGDGGPAASALLYAPTDIVLDSVGNLHIADFSNNLICKVENSPFTLRIRYAIVGLMWFDVPSYVITSVKPRRCCFML